MFLAAAAAAMATLAANRFTKPTRKIHDKVPSLVVKMDSPSPSEGEMLRILDLTTNH